jgi:hypothetical protein
LFLRSQGLPEFVVVLEAQGGPDDAPDASANVGQDVDVGLEFWYPFVIMSIKECHQSVPDVKDAKHVPQDRGDVQHQVGRHQPQCDHDGDFGRVLTVACGWNASHQSNQ